MRIVNKEAKIGSNVRKIYYEQFNNYSEYMKIVEQREIENAHNYEHNLEHICDRKEWVGIGSFNEAKELLLKGWDAKIDYIKEKLKKEIDLCDDKQVVKYFNDVVGFMPVVPNAIMNLPNCMINNKNSFKKTKIIKFMVCMNRSCCYSSNEIIEKMSKILAKIAILEKHGYSCRIELFGSFSSERENNVLVCHSVLLKNENQPFDLLRMAFPIAHTAMQRCIGFAWENSLPINYNSYHLSSLGSSIQYWSENGRNDLLNAVNESKEKIILIGMESDVDILKEVSK